MWTIMAWLAAAWPCGGMFCEQNVGIRVDQAGERIVFFVDQDRRQTQMHIEIAYEGRAEDFAWIVPVPSEPELTLSTVALFETLSTATAARYNLNRPRAGTCIEPVRLGCVHELGIATGGANGMANPSVDVVSMETVGAFETVTLRADSEQALVEWLQTNDYDVPEDLSHVLAPYIAEHSWFLAMRLAKGTEVGTLEPIALTFANTTTPTIPMRLTAVAATPDMPVTVWVLSDRPYGPSNAPRVWLNPARLGWWSDFDNYDEVLSEAIDEAGGQAWHADTLVASNTVPPIYGPMLETLPAQLENADAHEFYQLLRQALTPGGFRPPPERLESSLASCTPEGEGFWSDLFAYPEALAEFDAVACAALVEERLLEPRRRANQLLAVEQVVSRWRTVLSPEEMQIDPTFDPVDDLTIDERRGSDTAWCGTGKGRTKQRRTLEIGEYSIPMPSSSWLRDEGMDSQSWLEQVDLPAAERIDMRTADGGWEVLVDERQTIADALGALRKEGPAGRPCGLPTGRGGFSLLLAGTAVFLRRRRFMPPNNRGL